MAADSFGSIRTAVAVRKFTIIPARPAQFAVQDPRDPRETDPPEPEVFETTPEQPGHMTVELEFWGSPTIADFAHALETMVITTGARIDVWTTPTSKAPKP